MSAKLHNEKLSKGAGPNNERGKAENYEVGYGRPPKEFQFRPGRSGNPRGRPRRTLSFVPELADGLYQLLADDSDPSITHKQAIVNTVMAAARKNAKLGFALMDFCEKYGRQQADPGAADDDAFVEKLAAREPGAAEAQGTENDQ
jgi:hypothetical protein